MLSFPGLVSREHPRRDPQLLGPFHRGPIAGRSTMRKYWDLAYHRRGGPWRSAPEEWGRELRDFFFLFIDCLGSDGRVERHRPGRREGWPVLVRGLDSGPGG